MRTHGQYLTNGHFAYRERKTAAGGAGKFSVLLPSLRTCQKNSQVTRERLTDSGEHRGKTGLPLTKSAKNGV